MASKTRTALRLGELADISRSVAVGGISAALAGTLVGGLGGRLAMRLSALADPAAAGNVTDAGNRVGEITLDGTIELLLFGGLFSGFVAAVVWLAIRPWLEPLGEWRSLVAGLLAPAATGFLVIEAGNPDFSRIGPPWLNVTMFLVLLFAAGVLLAEFDKAFSRRFPLARSGWSVVYGAIALLLAVLAVPVFVLYVNSDAQLVRVIGWSVALSGLATAGWWIDSVRTGAEMEPRFWMRVAGSIGVLGVGMAGIVNLVPTVVNILT